MGCVTRPVYGGGSTLFKKKPRSPFSNFPFGPQNKTDFRTTGLRCAHVLGYHANGIGTPRRHETVHVETGENGENRPHTHSRNTSQRSGVFRFTDVAALFCLRCPLSHPSGALVAQSLSSLRPHPARYPGPLQTIADRRGWALITPLAMTAVFTYMYSALGLEGKRLFPVLRCFTSSSHSLSGTFSRAPSQTVQPRWSRTWTWSPKSISTRSPAHLLGLDQRGGPGVLLLALGRRGRRVFVPLSSNLLRLSPGPSVPAPCGMALASRHLLFPTPSDPGHRVYHLDTPGVFPRCRTSYFPGSDSLAHHPTPFSMRWVRSPAGVIPPLSTSIP